MNSILLKNFYNKILECVNNSELTIGDAYFVLLSVTKELEKMFEIDCLTAKDNEISSEGEIDLNTIPKESLKEIEEAINNESK